MDIDWSKSRIVNALNDCISVMERELSGLAVIQPELANAKEAMALMVKEGINGKPEWNGEGLPPVGTVCERRTHPTAQGGRYEEVKIIAYTSRGNPVWENTDGDFAGIAKLPHTVGGHPEFRPILTPEQIAAEERKQLQLLACADIKADLAQYNTSIDCSAAIRATVDAMIAAGYRKQEQPK